MPQNRATQFRARGADDRCTFRSANAANATARMPSAETRTPSAPPAPIVCGQNTLVDSATLRTLAEQLRTVSDGLLATHNGMHEARQEASDAKADAAEAIIQNRALKLMLIRTSLREGLPGCQTTGGMHAGSN
jgi:hypothetical protein